MFIAFFLTFQHALAADPSVLLEQGMAAQRSGDVTGAKMHYLQCLEESPTYVLCHWELGWSHWTAGEWTQVVEHWQKVKALEPGHPEVDKHLPTAVAHVESLAAIRSTGGRAPQTVRADLPEGRTLRLRSVGDIMMGTDFPDPVAYLPANDGAELLDGVATLLGDHDLLFGNLEGPLCDGGTTSKCSAGSNCYAFRTPTRYGAYLTEVGFDLMSTANNHAEDFGLECRTQTEHTLTKLGIAHSGRPGSMAITEHEGATVAMIGFHTSRNSNYVNDHVVAQALVLNAKAQADYVIVSFHGGAEGSKALHVPDKMETFYGEKRGHLRAFARAVVEAGADLVIGHGPHVPRGMELIDGHLVAYSLGNFATYGRFNLSGHLSTSLVLETTLDHEGKLVGGRIFAVRLEGEGVPMPDPENTAVDLIRSLSDEDFGTASPIIAQDGTFGPR